ncbi:hypothetical protein GCM10023238_31560 [Streptomyces heliomycini]
MALTRTDDGHHLESRPGPGAVSRPLVARLRQSDGRVAAVAALLGHGRRRHVVAEAVNQLSEWPCRDLGGTGLFAPMSPPSPAMASRAVPWVAVSRIIC